MIEDRYYMRESSFDPRRSATIFLIVANVVAFFAECLRYGYPPHFPSGDYLALSWDGLKHGHVWQLLTFQFMHAGLLHLLFNCWAIFVVGRDVEKELGIKRFLILYFGSGVVGGLFQAFAGSLSQVFPASHWAHAFTAPTVGASAGGLGLIAAYSRLFPERVLTMLIYFIVPVTMRAKFLLVFTGLISLFGLLFPGATGSVADAAHLGGMLAGVLFVRYALNWNLEWLNLRKRGAAPRRLVKVSSASSARWGRAKPISEGEVAPEDFLTQEVDPILDKISAHGIQSLTERERRVLEAARQRMGKR
jgi:membrane associated rhomboid family serine protease